MGSCTLLWLFREAPVVGFRGSIWKNSVARSQRSIWKCFRERTPQHQLSSGLPLTRSSDPLNERCHPLHPGRFDPHPLQANFPKNPQKSLKINDFFENFQKYLPFSNSRPSFLLLTFATPPPSTAKRRPLPAASSTLPHGKVDGGRRAGGG